MYQVNQFNINEETSSITKPFSLTPNGMQSKFLPVTQSTTNKFQQSSQKKTQSKPFICPQCPKHLSHVTEVKKNEIKLQYEVQKLKEEIQHLKRQNQHLKQLQIDFHTKQVQKYNPIMYFKQDLQAQLYEAKYLLQLQMLATQKSCHDQQPIKSNKNNIKTNQNIKQSQKQKLSMEKLSKPIDLKVKCEELLFENIKLQQKLMIRDKIIEERVLFPLYHYDQRILMLRKQVEHWYRKAEQESGKLAQVLVEVKKSQKQLKRQAKMMIAQQKTYWENEFKKILTSLSTQIGDSQASQKITNQALNVTTNQSKLSLNQTKQYNSNKENNILIEDDHTIYSLCEKMMGNHSHTNINKNTKSTVNKVKQKQKPIKRKSINYFTSSPQQHQQEQILCESCLHLNVDNEQKKRSKNCSLIEGNLRNKKQLKSVNNSKSGKNSAKNQHKYDASSIERKSDDNMKRVMRRKNVNEANNNSSLLGKNFQNIEIKVKQKQKCDQQYCQKKSSITVIKNAQKKSSLSEFSCQRCADRIL